MVFHRIKKINGKNSNYLIENFKFQNKVYQVQKYIGVGKIYKSEIKKLKIKYKDWFKNRIIIKKSELSAAIYKSKLLTKKDIVVLEKIRYVYNEFSKGLFPNELETIERDFNIKYIHATTATEGNTCTLAEVAGILDRSLSPKGRTLREIYEIRNFEEVLKFRNEYRGDLSKNFILKLHELVMKDIDLFTLGTFRRIEVAIRGSETTPTPAIFIEEETQKLLKWYHKNKVKLHPIELATLAHFKFEKIHPFTDGNGRVGREIFNYIINQHKFPPLNFDIKKRDEYINGLEMANKGKFKPIINYVINNYIEQIKLRLGNNPLKELFS
jgi:Fic family protein